MSVLFFYGTRFEIIDKNQLDSFIYSTSMVNEFDLPSRYFVKK